MPRKPALSAERNAPARAFALPEKTDTAPRQAAAPETSRKEGKPNEAEGPKAKKDNVQPGQGATHRSDRANAVARGSGLGRPQTAGQEDQDAAKAQEAETVAGAQAEAEGGPDAIKAAGLSEAGEELATASDAAPAAAQPEATPALQGEAQPALSAPPADPVVALQLANAAPAVQPEAEEPATEAAPETATDEQSGQPEAAASTAPPTGEPVPFTPVAAPVPGAPADPALAAPEGAGMAAPDIGHAATRTSIAGAQVAAESPATGETQGELQDKVAGAAPQGQLNGQNGEAAQRTQDAQPAARAEAPPAQPVIATGQPLPRAGDHHHRPEQGQAPQLPQPPESRPTPIQGVPLEVGFRSLEGHKRFDIRLDPGDLGRVEVRLELGDEGSVKATLTVERPETLQMMQRETRALERALEQAGFRPSDGSIDLRLSDRAPDRQQGGEREQPRHNPAKPEAGGETETVRLLHPAQLSRHVAQAMGGVDLVI